MDIFAASSAVRTSSYKVCNYSLPEDLKTYEGRARVELACQPPGRPILSSLLLPRIRKLCLCPGQNALYGPSEESASPAGRPAVTHPCPGGPSYIGLSGPRASLPRVLHCTRRTTLGPDGPPAAAPHIFLPGYTYLLIWSSGLGLPSPRTSLKGT